jgi:hypothetical protein
MKIVKVKKKRKNQKKKSSKKPDYELNFIKSHKYTVSDIKLLEKLYDKIDDDMEKADDDDDEMERLQDLQADLYDLLKKLNKEKTEGSGEDNEPQNPSQHKIESHNERIVAIGKEISNIAKNPHANMRIEIQQLTDEKNKLFAEVEKLSKWTAPTKKGTSIVNSRSTLKGKEVHMYGGAFQKTHGLSTTTQAYFYIYFDKTPPKKGRTTYVPATADLAINNNMVSLYGVHAIPENLEKTAKVIGHSGKYDNLNKPQLEKLFLMFKAKLSGTKRKYKDFLLKLERPKNEEHFDEYREELKKLDYMGEQIYIQLGNILAKLSELSKTEHTPLPKWRSLSETVKLDTYEPAPAQAPAQVPIPVHIPRQPKGEYEPKHKETPKSNLDFNPIETNFKPSKISHVFKNGDDTEIHLDNKYFNGDIIKDKYAKKLEEKHIFLLPQFYTEKMVNTLFYKNTGMVMGSGIHGGKLNAKQFFNKVGSTLTNVGNQIKTGLQSGANYVNKVIHGSDEYLPPVKNIINQYGENTITGVTIGRAPVPGAITGALNAVSGGTFKEGMNTQPYDKLFHLFLYLTLNSGVKILFEKNATINSAVNPPLPPNTETLLITPTNNTTTLKTFLQNGQNRMGNKYFVYDPHYNNCQDYIIGLLTGNGWGTQQDYKWIKQDTGQLFANNKYLGTVAKGVTNFGGVVDRVINGVGFTVNHKPWISHHGHIQSILFKRPEYTEAKAKHWLTTRHFKTSVDIKPEHLRYRQEEPDETKYTYKTKKINKNIDFVIGYPIKPEDLKYANL